MEAPKGENKSTEMIKSERKRRKIVTVGVVLGIVVRSIAIKEKHIEREREL